MPRPSIRASFFHSNLEALAALGPSAAARVRARIPQEVLREVEAAVRVAWLPVEHDVAITEAVEAELGRAALREWACDGVVRAADTPLLTPIIRSARAIFGMTPHALLRRVPLAWTVLYRDCGRMEHAALGDRAAHLTLVDAPAPIAASQPYLEGLCGGLEAAIVLAGESGRVHHELDGAGPPTFVAAW